MLEKEYEYFLSNLPEFLKQHRGKYLVIKELELVGVFDTEKEAIEFALSKFDLGTFLVQFCIEPEKNTANFVNYRFILGNEAI